MKVWSPEQAQTLKYFLYGDPGGGKTTHIATAMDDPRTSPMLLLNCGGNPDSLRFRSTLPTIVTIELVSELNPFYDWLYAGQPTGPLDLPARAKEKLGLTLTPPYRSVGIDGATELQRIIMDENLGNKGKSPGDSLKSAQIQDWGRVLQQVTYLTRLFYGLAESRPAADGITIIPGISILITALEKIDQDQLTGVMSYGPGLWGQSRAEVPAYSLLTSRLVRRNKLTQAMITETGEAYGVAFFDQLGKFLAKDQYGGKLPGYMANPTISKIMTAIYGPA